MPLWDRFTESSRSLNRVSDADPYNGPMTRSGMPSHSRPLRAGRIGISGVVMGLATALLVVGLHHPKGPGSALVQGEETARTAQGTGGSRTPAPSGSPHGRPSHASSTAGPLLSSTPYASAAYLIYPGPMSPGAKQAIDGFSFSFAGAGASGELVRVYVIGQKAPVLSRVFPSSEHLYFIETSFGDDPPGADLNGGDDSLVLTDARGHIIQ